MGLALGFHQAELRTEFPVGRVGFIAHDGQAGAFGRAVPGEGRHQDVAAGAHGARDLGDVAPTVPLAGEEVEDGPVVPDVEGIGGKIGFQDIRASPFHVLDPVRQARP